ncbi:MAG: hypothetical protein WC855_03140 [Thermodesulfovibrionales bacterium]
MKHKHTYETISHHSPTPGTIKLGIKAAELRRCTACKKEMTFILTKEGWFPLFEDKEADKQDILLA